MTAPPPVLLLGFNRPHKMAQLIAALSVSKPSQVLIGVDGPRVNNAKDADLVRLTQETAELITWPATVVTRFRNENLGLRAAVVDAVTWATSEYGKVIVIEDDCIPGPDFVPFSTNMLERFENEPRIGHINGYNLVASENLSSPGSPIRLTRYPESYAWATWERAWKNYDNDLTWASQCSLHELQKITNSYVGALRWKINFADAKSERIQTWAYRWLASMWKNNLSIIAPSANLVRYDGHEDGTHTRRTARWTELPMTKQVLNDQHESLDSLLHDEKADHWIAKQVFRENALGIFEGVAASVVMEILKRRPNTSRKGTN
jgi:hypothetical protein